MSEGRRPKRKAGMGYIMILLLILVAFAAAGVFISKRFAPSKAQTDLAVYYNLTAYESADRPAAGPEEYAIILNDHVLDNDDISCFRAVEIDGGLYVGLPLVKKYIDDRFYLDSREDLVIHTDALHSVKASIGSAGYTAGGETVDAGYVPAVSLDGQIYLNLEYVRQLSPLSYQAFSDPSRVLLFNEFGDLVCCRATADITMRASDSKRHPLLRQFQGIRRCGLSAPRRKAGCRCSIPTATWDMCRNSLSAPGKYRQ